MHAGAEQRDHAARVVVRDEQLASPLPLLLPLPSDGEVPRAAIGGKAWSLQQLASAGFAVPPAVILTTGFFAPWVARLRATPAWEALLGSPRSGWAPHCAALAAQIHGLALEAAQRDALAQLRGLCGADCEGARFAVRSSSPDEDLAGASYAGMYRSLLGVPGPELERAIRDCFASCLDARVLAYKAARGLPVFEPAIAVVVQHQVDSEVAGVGFSINPLTNDFDEMLVSASWGLGESVVDGSVMPDQFVLDKTNGHLLAQTLGSKQSRSVLAPQGGTRRDETRRDGFCLSMAQLAALKEVLLRLEALFGFPVDVEFACAGGALHLLQARPVTAYVPLAPEMCTAPGAPRRLYMDVALAKGLTLDAPVSPMGQDWLKQVIGRMIAHCAGPVDFPLDRPDGWLCIGGGRMYLNLSRLLWLATPAKLARSNAPTDRLLAETLATIDVARYRAPVRPPLLPALRLLPRVLWTLRRGLWRSAVAFVAPERAHRRYLARERACIDRLKAPVAADLTPAQAGEELAPQAMKAILEVAMPAMLAGVGAMGMMAGLAHKRRPDEQSLMAQLMLGTSGNLVVGMGIAMFRLARMLAPADYADLDALKARIARREMPPAFLHAWDAFLDRHGCRGPGEMDLANPAYADDPLMLLRQMSFMAAAPAEVDPEQAQRELAARREDGYRQLQARFGWLRRLLLRRLYRISGLFAGTRDTPKYFKLLARQQVRRQALAAGEALVAKGRLDRPEDVFGLCHADLEAELEAELAAAGAGAAGFLRARRAQRTAFADLLARQVHAFPALIDSRGRILRAPPGADVPGQLRGVPLSPGVARGRVKCLGNAHEKSIEPGDILVARTTDPGWTPLFVSAGAIVLEVGGVLQHGALVAREFNKPCVAGIADVLRRLHDGQFVEVDGGHGTVTVLELARQH
ncbi:PEP/pyruvate-binding domain-containing protein [Massilia consociata]|uniref:PEP/pyruvate-binding domain-containing protein n=1 Tax=Massilia consociata TaxID=760117 RepID=A0ABV6FH93_9BURK